MNDARRTALTAVLAWDRGEAEDVESSLATLPDARDAALARELATGAVAWMRLYDVLADRFLRPGRQPMELRWGLRLMAHQLFALDRIPPHAAVGETVGAMRADGLGQLAGVANAVGRKLAALRQESRDGDGPLGRLPVEVHPVELGERLSLPDRLIADLRQVLPTGNPERDLAALVRLVPLCTRTIAGVAPVRGRSILRQEGPWTWWDDPQEALTGPVADGLAVVQDRSQGHVAELARIRPGELVLDLCAAPGGKSRALAEAGARVIAADAIITKVRAMGASFAHLSNRPAVLAQDGRRSAFAPGSFDLVLIDAPCSNSGVLARRPEARWRYDDRHLTSLAALQRHLLGTTAKLVRPGGRLLYSTCSLAPCENQAITHQLAGWRILAEHLAWPDAWQAGGYAAVLVRN